MTVNRKKNEVKIEKKPFYAVTHKKPEAFSKYKTTSRKMKEQISNKQKKV